MQQSCEAPLRFQGLPGGSRSCKLQSRHQPVTNSWHPEDRPGLWPPAAHLEAGHVTQVGIRARRLLRGRRKTKHSGMATAVLALMAAPSRAPLTAASCNRAVVADRLPSPQ